MKPLLLTLVGLFSLASFAHAKPAITSPVPNSILPPGGSVTFEWTDGGRTDINAFYLYAGGSLGSSNYAARSLTANTTSATLAIPAPAVSVYVRLWFRVGRTWDYSDFAYRRTAAPAAHRELTSATGTFQWPAAGGISFWVYVGSRLGGKDMANSGALNAPSWTVNNLPTDGRLIHVRKWTQASNGQWTYTDNVYATVAIGFETEEEERNEFPLDLDDDGIRNEADPDLDGDGVSNASDPDIDGDGLVNEIDSDDDGDGISDNADSEPNGPTPETHHEVSVNYGLYGGERLTRNPRSWGPLRLEHRP